MSSLRKMMERPAAGKRVAVLGSTGSIGCNALEVIEHLGPPYCPVALSAHKQTDKLLEQAARCKPVALAVSDVDCKPTTIAKLRDVVPDVYVGPQGLVDLVRRDDVDVVLAAVVGAAGLPAVIAAVEAGKTLALANKESLVVAGSLLMPAAKKSGATILPVDSEHSAIFQAMLAGRRHEVKRVILTASGGPFRTWSAERIGAATYADALAHPTWKMGSKITIDSATMFNKALELIEACWLFDLPPEQIEVVVHPESIVHSMVEFVDGSTIAQLSPPDMRTPIQYALTYPDRTPGPARRLDLTTSFTLNFEPPDLNRFPALRIAYQVARLGGTSGAVLNAANEAAVETFAADKIGFGDIPRLVEATLDQHRVQPAPTLADLFEADRWARAAVEAAASGRR
ncbi:MAG TPA: 1-deoxy-D-xylulose-5-phosphate reductoisomerase [Tepidisphaeraceae bacterium]|nr:1-deoxy-D-xylulose-5-phosphate reductoisomerase [Tepidisphaeraceae bacterium]